MLGVFFNTYGNKKKELKIKYMHLKQSTPV